MATVYSSWVATDDWRVILTYTVTSPSDTTTQIAMTSQVESVYATATGCVYGKLTCGSSTSSTTTATMTAGKTTTIQSHTFTITRTSSTQSITLAAKVWIPTSSYSSYQSGATASTTCTVPTITYSVPNAPTSLAVTRNSDTSHKLTWSSTTSTTQPITKIYIYRTVDSGSESTLTTSTTSSLTSYTDTTTSADHYYQWRLRNYNSAGYSSYSSSVSAYTTPAAPTSVKASVTSGTSVSIVASGYGTYATSFDCARSTDGGSSWTTVSSGSSSATFTDSITGTARWRVRACRDSLASSWTSSSDITTVIQPSAPTVSISPAICASDGTLTVKWTPNHSDGSDQTAAQVEFTSPSGIVTTYEVTGTTTSFVLGSLEIGAYSARVRTQGAYDGWGTWSSSVTATVYNLPAVGIVSPKDGAVISGLPLLISWTAEDETGISWQELTIADSTGAEVYSATLGGDVREFLLDSSSFLPQNLGSYSTTILAQAGSTLSASDSVTFETNWDEPAPPSLEWHTEEDRLGVTGIVSFGDGEPATVAVDVIRVLADGSEFLLASGLTDLGSFLDPLPPLNTSYSYRIISFAEAGSTSETLVEAFVPSDVWAFNWGVSAENFILLWGNAAQSGSNSIGGELFHFADGGENGGLPVFYAVSELDSSLSLSFTAEQDKAETVRTVSRTVPVLWIRDPLGHRWRSRCEWSFTAVFGQVPCTNVSCSASEVVWEEPSNG